MDYIESQKMELLALQSIYEEKYFKIDGMNPPSGHFIANVRLPKNFFVSYKVLQTHSIEFSSQDNTIPVEESFQVEYLPPVNLFFEFPETYPQKTCPAFLLSCNWLTLQQLTYLCKYLESLWDLSKDVILFIWFQFLQEELLDFLEITDSLMITDLLKFKIHDNFKYYKILDNAEENVCTSNACCTSNSFQFDRNLQLQDIKPSVFGGTDPIDARAINDLVDGKVLVHLLKEYNEKKKDDIFQNSSQVCDICFTTKQGSEFVTFIPCRHSFCKECIKSYFEVQIQEGNVNFLHCPEEGCETQADGSIVQKVVSKDIFEKYDRLILSRTLQKMSDVSFCPRLPCQCPVLLDISGNMGTCSACSFVFCSLCRKAFHGVVPCCIKPKEPNLEEQCGKKMKEYEESYSEAWKRTNSKNCPQCKACIQKSGGCNKMTCYNCGTFFCYLCNTHLKMSNPYDHFKTSRLKCTLYTEEDIYSENSSE